MTLWRKLPHPPIVQPYDEDLHLIAREAEHPLQLTKDAAAGPAAAAACRRHGPPLKPQPRGVV